jgi:hypothetical protein
MGYGFGGFLVVTTTYADGTQSVTEHRTQM